jgi:hypothetical protein
MLSFFSRPPWCLLLFIVVFVCHFEARVATSFDSGWSMPLALSLIEDGDLDLDEYRAFATPGDYRLIEVDGHLRSRYPVASAILATPVVWVVKKMTWQLYNLRLRTVWLAGNWPKGLERLAASLCVAATTVLLFRLLLAQTGTGIAVVSAWLFAFATSAFSVVSRAYWQHGPSILLLTLALFFWQKVEGDRHFLFWTGLTLALAYAVRPTNILGLVAFTLLALVLERRRSWPFFAGVAAILIPLSLFNLSYYGHALASYPGGMAFSLGGLAEGLAGTLFSPGRGLFVYSPILLFAVWGMVVKRRQGDWRPLDTALLAVLLCHWLLISSWFSWWGGASFGPRLFADILPILVFFLPPAFVWIARPRPWRPLALALATTAALASLAIHYVGAHRWAVWFWNNEPLSIEVEQTRLWDWRDPPFLRHLERPESYDELHRLALAAQAKSGGA